ncbi:hypothetical protein LPJ66_000426 [Kickxella alabastrina]|uniref:Uncharacterized protein n=1 Tax=Kickxella alabastrina TaxID=61397 RepID=A0ACC1IW77_9FUNG|nr:hypothetical protein LPJ66_000426 [Kickxella alabastrina]
MYHPSPDQSSSSLGAFLSETEDHVIYGQNIKVHATQSSENSTLGWSLTTVGGSWHVWNYESIVDRLDMPLWAEGMDEVRVVLSSEMCRERIYLPPAPFMPPRNLEYCGIHVMATGVPGMNADERALVRGRMRKWMSVFMGWTPKAGHGAGNEDKRAEPRSQSSMLADLENEGDFDEGDFDESDSVGGKTQSGSELGPESFIDAAQSSIYYFQEFPDSRSLDGHQGSRLDLMHFATGSSGHILRALPTAHVSHKGLSWLDNHRVEVRLRRTPLGFIKVAIQTISLLHPSAAISISALSGSSSQLAWIAPTPESPSFTMTAGQKKPAPLDIPGLFYAQHDTSTQPAGLVTQRTQDFASFHPSLRISAHADLTSAHLSSGTCRIELLVFLPPTYFFDPYQLQEVRGQLGMGYHHFGPVELEKPAESMPNWGSVLVVSQYPRLTDLNAVIPVHARYRLPPAHRLRTVGYNGEPSGNTHVDTTLLPAIAAIVCPAVETAEGRSGNRMLDNLRVRLALFDELGMTPVGALEIAQDTDTLLRMPVGDAEYVALIRAMTLVALFAGTVFIVGAVRRKSLQQMDSGSENVAKDESEN